MRLSFFVSKLVFGLLLDRSSKVCLFEANGFYIGPDTFS